MQNLKYETDCVTKISLIFFFYSNNHILKIINTAVQWRF